MRRLLQSVRSIRGGGSCAQELCYLACGRIDVILTVNQSFWDYAAGALILEEAGGKITTTTGEELSVVKYMNAKFDLLASNKILHLESILKGI
jgi:fructose-1,6-bisphosphatase/inositol monophosphatase family enzyme